MPNLAIPLSHAPVRVLAVGPYESHPEQEAGAAFVGTSGILLRQWLEIAGLSREWETAVMNMPVNRGHLLFMQPQLIVGFGASVRDEMSPLREFTRAVSHSPGKVATFYTYHPLAMMQNATWKNRFWADAETVKRWLRDNPWTAPPPVPRPA